MTFPSHDDISKECTLLLCDIAEVQLSGMDQKSAYALYSTVLYAFSLISTRLQQPISVAGELAQFEEEYRNDILFICVSLLNHLVTKDLQLLLDDGNAFPSNLSNSFSKKLIPEVLLNGLDMVVSVLTPEILKRFPATADRYFRFVMCICDVYILHYGALLY